MRSVSWLIGLVIAASAFGQDQLCPKCKTTGRIESKIPEDPLERNVLFCSTRLKRDETKGLGWKPCEGCKAVSLAAEARKEFEANAAIANEWLQKQAKVDKDLGAQLETIESEHFILTWGVEGFTGADKKVYDAHAGMHLFASRLEIFYHQFHQELNVSDDLLRNRKHHVYVFKDKRTLVKCSELYLGMSSDTCALAGGDPSLFATWWDKNNFHSDRSFHRHLVHNVTHLLMAVVKLKTLLDEYGFLYEGLGHYFEILNFGASGNSCNREQAEEDLEKVDFEIEVARAVRLGTPPGFAVISVKKTTDLHGIDHAFAWSYAQFLMNRSPKGVRDLVMRLKEGKQPLREALKEIFGLSFGELDNQWLDYVKKNYSEVRRTR